MVKFSIVIPTYNRAELLDKAIASALSQSGVEFEVVISDNCSQDHTKEIVAKYRADPRVRYFRNDENIGMVRNWRKAVYEYATGDWFLLLSDDDYFVDPDYLAKAYELIKKYSSLVMVYAEGYILDLDSGERKVLKLPFDEAVRGGDLFASRGTISPQDFTLCNVVFNRQLAIELNSFSNPNNLSCDSELFLKLCMLGDVGVVKGPVSVYCFHSGNLIKTVGTSAELAYGNLDFLVNPYAFAKGRASASQLAQYQQNVRLKEVVAACLLAMARSGWSRYSWCRRDLMTRVPDIVDAAMGSMRYRLRIYRYCIRAWFGSWSSVIVVAVRSMSGGVKKS